MAAPNSRLLRSRVADLVFDLGYVLDKDVDLDVTPPEGFLDQLAARTGVSRERIQMMSISGYIPWLIDDFSPGPEAFSTYTQQLSVLLPRGRRRPRVVESWTPWLSQQRHDRFCPVCLTQSAPIYPYQLFWSWPVMLTCPFHRCPLEAYDGVPGYYAYLEPFAPPAVIYPPDHPVVVMDARTWQALSFGYVDLPRYRVHAGLWFRLLRALIEELGATLHDCGAAQRLTRAVWEQAGYRSRAGQHAWRPYEHLSVIQQQQTLEAAAIAMHLLETSAFTGRGQEAALFLPEPDASIDPGPPREEKNPLARSWQAVQDSFNAAIEKAKHDPETARDLFSFMTYGQTDEKFLQQTRDTFVRLGIPLEFLSH